MVMLRLWIACSYVVMDASGTPLNTIMAEVELATKRSKDWIDISRVTHLLGLVHTRFILKQQIVHLLRLHYGSTNTEIPNP